MCPAKVVHLYPKHVAEHPDNLLTYFVMLASSFLRALVFQMVSVFRVFLTKLCMQLWYLPSGSHLLPISSSMFNRSNREEHRLNVFENRMLLKIFVLARDEVAGAWRTVHTEEVHGVVPQNIIWVIRSRMMRWQEQLPYVREKCIENFGGET